LKDQKNRADIRRLTSFERFSCETENLVFDYLIYLEPVERFKNRSNVMKFRSFGDNTSSRVNDKLKTIRLCSRLNEWERVTAVNFRMNERSNNGAGSILINSSKQINFEIYIADQKATTCI